MSSSKKKAPLDLSVLNVHPYEKTDYSYLNDMGPQTLEDILPIEKDLTIFTDSLRTFPDILEKLDDPEQRLTLFAPTNSVLRNFSVRLDSFIEDKISDEPEEKLHQFVLGHIVPKSLTLLKDGEELVTLSNSTKIQIKKVGNKYILNNEVNVGEQIETTNGIIYKVDGILVKHY
ncbi:hypothetical protein G9A89_003748 [Geosiphon pyriformis]|nr:hypothetical protein G9A89_003748 [Geosiphon pyriformis]